MGRPEASRPGIGDRAGLTCLGSALVDRTDPQPGDVLRDPLEVLTTFGEGGRQPGEFYGPHSIATDSKGNIYVTETYRGQRVQKFVYKGLGPVTKEDQGVLWPTTKK